MSGLKLAALYGIVTHRLGFCGPQEKTAKKILLDYISGKDIPKGEIRKLLKNFKGAFPYYKLIARANKIKDPFEKRVVKAYWIGNQLLEKVKTPGLKKMIVHDFSTEGLLEEKEAKLRAKTVPPGSKPHHSFHVLEIGSVSGRIVLTKKLVDLCRIGWGKVRKIDKAQNEIKVEYQPLTFNKKPHLGNLKKKYLIWDKNILPKIKLGNQVSFHWNYAIQVLNKKEAKNLKKYTQKTINSFRNPKNLQ